LIRKFSVSIGDVVQILVSQSAFDT